GSSRASAAIRAHLIVGGGLGGPLRDLPQESVARAKPALEAATRRSTCCALLATSREGVPLSSAGWACATIPGGGSASGRSPLRGERTGSTPPARTRAPPCSWTLLATLAERFPRHAPSAPTRAHLPVGGLGGPSDRASLLLRNGLLSRRC